MENLEPEIFFDKILEFIIFVLIKPGSIITTLIPKGSNSYDNDSLIPSNANFVLLYADKTGTLIRPPTELMFTIKPPPCCVLIIGKEFCITLITPKKFVSNCDFISSNDISSREPKSPYPALFTNTSILFFSLPILSIASLTELSLLTSSSTNCNDKFFFSAMSVIFFDFLIFRIEAYV